MRSSKKSSEGNTAADGVGFCSERAIVSQDMSARQSMPDETLYGVSHSCDWGAAPFKELGDARYEGAVHVAFCMGFIPVSADVPKAELTFWSIAEELVTVIGGLRDGEVSLLKRGDMEI